MLSRRLACFRTNMDMLCTGKRTYLWTFTLPELRDYETVRKDWNRCLTYLRRMLPAWRGIRVYEVHPGQWDVRSHGLHVHIVSNKFHDVNLVRQAAQRAGFGRVHVCRRRQSMGYYLAKYLAKPRPDALKSWRLWACFNFPERMRLSDFYMDSLRSRIFRAGHASGVFGPSRIGYGRDPKTGKMTSPRGAMGWAEKVALVGHWVWQYVAGQRLTIPMRPWQAPDAPVPRGVGFGDYLPEKFRKPVPAAFVARDLPFGFHAVSPAPVPGPRYAFASSTSGWEDSTLQDVRRNAALHRYLEGGQPF